MMLVARVGSAVWLRGGLAALLALLAAAALLSLSPAQAQQIQVAPATVTLSDPVGSTAVWNYFYVEARVQIGQTEECSGDAEVVTRRPVTNDDQNGDGTVTPDEHYYVEDRDGECKEGREDEAVITPIYADSATVTWGTTPEDQTAVRRVTSLTSDTDTNGRAWAVFRVLAAGDATITATTTVTPRPEASGSLDVTTGQSVAGSPPGPGKVWLISAPDQRRAEDRFTVTALVTDANGAASPDGTPVTWRAIGFADAGSQPASLDTNIWLAGATQRVTSDGTAEATFTRISGNDNKNVLVIASSGDASGAVWMETGLTAATGTYTAAIELEPATAGTGDDAITVEQWRLLDRDDTTSITLNAKLTDPDGDPVPDGRLVYWDEGGIPATAGETVLSKGGVDPTITYSTTTTLGGGDPAGKAAYTFDLDGDGRGYVIARRGAAITMTRTVIIFGVPMQVPTTTRVRHEHPIDIAWFNIGEYAALPDDLSFSLRLLGDSDNITAIGSTVRIGGQLTFSGPGDGLDQVLNVSAGTLRIAGVLEWEGSGRNTHTGVPGQTLRSRAALLREHAPLGRGLIGGSAADWATRAECRGSGETGLAQWTCSVDLGTAEIVIPDGAELGTFAVSGALTVNGTEVRSEPYQIRVIDPASFNEVAELQFDYAEQTVVSRRGQPYPSNLAAGESTRLRLKVLNEGGTASAPGTISSIFVTTSAGSLSTSVGGGCRNGGGLICQIPVSALSADNSDKIDVTLTYPAGAIAGDVQLRARLTKTDGAALTAGPLSARFLGGAETLNIAAPKSGVLNVNVESEDGAEAAGEDTDHRDRLTLAVTAAEAGGMKVALPAGRAPARVLDPDGKLVTSGVTVEWPLGGADEPTLNATGDEQVRIEVNRASTSPLAGGEYTIEVRAGSLTGRQTFVVSGAPATVALSAPAEDLIVGGQLTVTARVTDAAGSAVPNGTALEWSSTPTGAAVVLVELNRENTTTDGQASASYLVVTPGSVVVRAGANCADQATDETASAAAAARARTSQCAVSDVQLLSVPYPAGTEPTPPVPPGLAADLGGRAVVGYNTWLGDEPITAAELVADLMGINTVLFWRFDGVWLRYSVVAGIPIPGSTNFAITPGAVILLER